MTLKEKLNFYRALAKPFQKIYIYHSSMRWVQITPDVTLIYLHLFYTIDF